MKQLNINFSNRLLMTVCVLCVSFLTAHAQTAVAFLTPEFQCTSEASFDSSGNPMDSTVYLYTKKGYPFSKEVYSWDNTWLDDIKIILSSTGKIISDTGNDFTVELTLYDDEKQVEEVTNITYNCNDMGDVLKMESVSMKMDPGATSVTTIQYLRTGNRLDSTLSTTTMSAYDFTSTIKTIYKTYDSDGRPTLEEMYVSSSLGPSTRSVYKFAYFKNTSGKLEHEEVETDQYDTSGALESVAKNVTYYDAKERPVRTDEYFGPTLATLDIDTYTFFHYDGQTGVANPFVPVQPDIVGGSDGYLSISSSKAEWIEIFSVSGVQVYAGAKPAGKIQLPIYQLPKGIYIVKGSSGWTRKIVR